jgi:hypothetical protein
LARALPGGAHVGRWKGLSEGAADRGNLIDALLDRYSCNTVCLRRRPKAAKKMIYEERRFIFQYAQY